MGVHVETVMTKVKTSLVFTAERKVWCCLKAECTRVTNIEPL